MNLVCIICRYLQTYEAWTRGDGVGFPGDVITEKWVVRREGALRAAPAQELHKSLGWIKAAAEGSRGDRS
jgi:hypothetical protein